MRRIPLSVKNQSIETSGITKDYKEAICEYIWNGFEANAKNVELEWKHNQLDGGDIISIADNGDGINFNNLDNTFGTFLASQKNSLSLKAKSKANKGKGRFSFMCCASDVLWKTVYSDTETQTNYEYELSLSDSSKEFIDCSEPQPTIKGTGTIATLLNVFGFDLNDLQSEEFTNYLLTEFVWYLYLNKNTSLHVNGQVLDYSSYINTNLSEEINVNIFGHDFKINLIVWNAKIKEKFCCYYLDDNNSIKGKNTTTYNRNTIDFNHSVFIKSNFFNKLDVEKIDSPQMTFGGPDDGQGIIKELNKIVLDLISRKIDIYMSGKADTEIEKMIDERKTFPVFSSDIYGQYRKNDLKTVTKALYCAEPRIFYKLKEVQEKSLLAFLNLLLSSEERESVLDIINQIVNLSTEQRKQFASILNKTQLENIIETISFIENRYRIIETLKTLIYDLDKFTNERDHIQKIVEQNYWLFGEKYNLASADKTMTRALEGYLNILYGASKPDSKLDSDQELNRRMDIFLCGSRKTENSHETAIEENIVVELKAPKVPLTKTVLRQIEDYMDYVRRNSPFNGIHRRWKFIAVCKEVDDDVKAKYDTFKDRGKLGLVNITENYEIYALTWDDVFKSFEISHSFCLDKLKLDRDEIISKIKLSSEEKSKETVDKLTNAITSNSED